MRLVWVVIPLVLVVSLIGVFSLFFYVYDELSIEEKQQRILNNPKISDGLKHLLINNESPINNNRLNDSEILEITITITNFKKFDVLREHLIELILIDPTGFDSIEHRGQFFISAKVDKQKILEIAELDYVKEISFMRNYYEQT